MSRVRNNPRSSSKAEFANHEYIFRRIYCHVVPIYQRPYVWTQKEWEVMWPDVAYVADLTGAPEHAEPSPS